MTKRILAYILVLCMLLCGCSVTGDRIKSPAKFTYLCRDYQKNMCCVVLSEEREASGHIGDLSYLLALYLMGPVSDDLVSPLPSHTQILSIVQSGDQLTIKLSDLDHTLSDIDFSLAGACLTMTCLDNFTASKITVSSGTRSVTMDRDSLALFDSSAESTLKEQTQ